MRHKNSIAINHDLKDVNVFAVPILLWCTSHSSSVYTRSPFENISIIGIIGCQVQLKFADIIGVMNHPLSNGLGKVKKNSHYPIIFNRLLNLISFVWKFTSLKMSIKGLLLKTWKFFSWSRGFFRLEWMNNCKLDST